MPWRRRKTVAWWAAAAILGAVLTVSMATIAAVLALTYLGVK